MDVRRTVGGELPAPRGFVPPPSLREGADTASRRGLPATPLAALRTRAFLDTRARAPRKRAANAPARWRGALLRMVATAGGIEGCVDAALNAVC